VFADCSEVTSAVTARVSSQNVLSCAVVEIMLIYKGCSSAMFINNSK